MQKDTEHTVTNFILIKDGKEIHTTNLDLVEKLLSEGWKIKHNTLSELI